MSNKGIIAPSILNAKWWKLRKQLKILESEGAKYLHFDVMDGEFVPNKSFDDRKLRHVSRYTKMVNDVHLMVVNPENVIGKYVLAGADIITIHYEAFNNVDYLIKCLKLIREKDCKAGISIKPKTDINVLVPLLPYVDQILIMSVEPGLGGQKFIENSYSRIARLRQKVVESHFDIKIEVDGGINDTNALKVIESGADIIVVGSYLFGAEDIRANMEKLCLGMDIS
jgi:ribulose-phosphate 3-epimerase